MGVSPEIREAVATIVRRHSRENLPGTEDRTADAILALLQERGAIPLWRKIENGCPDSTVLVGRYDRHGNWLVGIVGGISANPVIGDTHWMPLPLPPES